MDKLILGLLVLKNFTIYDLQKTIGSTFKDLCSNSTGSIQAAIKKLLQHGMVSCHEYSENGRNKKEYCITQRGYEQFSTWINQPILNGLSNHMELGKLHFMGLAKKENRLSLVKNYITQLEDELSFLLAIEESINFDHSIEYAKSLLESAPEKALAIQELSGHTTLDESLKDISTFTVLSLHHGISQVRHELSWFENLKEKMEMGAL